MINSIFITAVNQSLQNQVGKNPALEFVAKIFENQNTNNKNNWIIIIFKTNYNIFIKVLKFICKKIIKIL